MHNIDLSQETTKLCSKNIAHDLLTSYKFTELRALFENGLIDVNKPSRTDGNGGLSHHLMETYRFHSFEKAYRKEFYDLVFCYDYILENCCTKNKGYYGDVIDCLLAKGDRRSLDYLTTKRSIKFSKKHKIKFMAKFNPEQLRNPDFENDVFQIIKRLSPELIQVESELLVRGINDHELERNDYLSLKDLKEKKITKIGNYSVFVEKAN